MPPSFGEVWAALAWGMLSSVGLVVGAVAGSFSRLSHHAIALAMSVGAGLLLAAASLELAAEAIRIAGPGPAVVSLLLGAAVLSAANALLRRRPPQALRGMHATALGVAAAGQRSGHRARHRT
jgi:zinc transporter ZupT